MRLFAKVKKDANGCVITLPRTHEDHVALVRWESASTGVPVVDDLRKLTWQQLHQVLEFHNNDVQGQILDLPCFSWRMPNENLIECHRLYRSRNHGDITPEEYKRRVRELAGLPPEEPSSSGV